MGVASRLLSTVSKKTIKPFSPTPSTQRLHKLCLPGQAFPPNHIPLVFFYPKQQVDTIFPNGHKQRLSKFLEISLSKTLTCYYPWAGRLKDNATVECNDVGAEYFEVQINSSMDEVLHHSDSRIKDLVTFPQGAPWGKCMDRALAIAQLSHFECGGIAISVCLSHKVGDACSCYCFLRDWASLTRDPNTKIASSPYFVEDSVIPSPLPDGPLASPVSKKKQECIEKTFDFSALKISPLKAFVEAESGVQNPTRNEVVNALVYKCAANAASIHQSHQLVQYTNIRPSVSPPLPPTSIGNLLTVFSTPIYNSSREGDFNLSKIVTDIRNSKQKLLSRDNIKENEWAWEIVNAYKTGKGTFQQRNCDVYVSTSLCQFPFHDLDFGWGKPSRARLGGHLISKFFSLMSTHDGGIQVSVHLNEQQMSVFENDQHLLQFATPTG
ncbi:acyltransferase Pun1-like [Nicotiana tabacum]|uniref:Acylsugar acyltransferase 3-like n=2 Tax=Nicotiana TaxID=4085 RepID=A0A1S3YLB9_TOBAC|nr:PREDICTED: deacetylvindoline O-acetyltransferase-like [Nicotiana sylvestris]XP_016453041.1 PREDICTED: acylsugar acyltransferase 3-like [Nicotiana tabacum]